MNSLYAEISTLKGITFKFCLRIMRATGLFCHNTNGKPVRKTYLGSFELISPHVERFNLFLLFAYVQRDRSNYLTQNQVLDVFVQNKVPYKIS
jgi:hypothetical protein